MKGYMYILECADGSFYTGSTNNLERRLWEHDHFMGSNYTKKKHPFKLVYYEEYTSIDKAFYREKQVQGWNRSKKKALIEGKNEKLPELSMAYRDIGTPRELQNTGASRTSATNASRTSATRTSSASANGLDSNSTTSSSTNNANTEIHPLRDAEALEAAVSEPFTDSKEKSI